MDKENAPLLQLQPQQGEPNDPSAVNERTYKLEAMLINSTEDVRQYQDKYVSIRDEGQRLYASYELKCTKLKEMRETNKFLEEKAMILSQELSAANHEIENLLDQRNVNLKYEEENQALFQQVEELTRQISTLHSSQTSDPSDAVISEQFTTLQNKLLEVRQSLETEQRMRDKAEAEQRELRSLLEQRVHEASIVESVPDRVEQTTQTAESARDEDRSDVEGAYQKQTQELQQELDAMRGEIQRKDAALADLSKRLSAAEAEASPPLVLEIKIQPSPPAPAPAPSPAANLIAFNLEQSSSLSKAELRDRLEEFCISNELLRDEINSLRTDIRSLEQEARAEAAKRFEANNEVEALREHLQQYTIDANKDMVQYQQQISELEEKMQSAADSASVELTYQRQGFEAELQVQADAAKSLEKELQQAVQNAAALREAAINAETQQRRIMEKKHADTIEQQQLQYKNLQNDLRRVYNKHKRDLSALEEKYQYSDYVSRYEAVCRRCCEGEKLLEQAMKTMPQRLHEAQSVAERLAHSMKEKMAQLLQAKDALVAMRDSVYESQMQAQQLQQQAQKAEQERESVRMELCAATEELELRGRVICELEQRVTELQRESCASMVSGVVSNVVSEAVFRSQQNSLAIAEEGVRDSESLQAQLAEMAEREWKICQSNAEIEKANAELRQKQRDLEHEAQRVEALEISLESKQSELKRIRREKEELVEFNEQERLITSEIHVDLEKNYIEMEQRYNECKQELDAMQVKVHDVVAEAAQRLREEQERLQAMTVERDAALLSCEKSEQGVDAQQQRLQRQVESLRLDLRIAIERVESSGESHERQTRVLKAELAEKEEKRRALELKLESVRAKTRAAQEEAEAKQLRAAELEGELEESDAQLQRQGVVAAEALARAGRDIDAARNKNEELVAQLARAQGRQEAVQARYENAQVERKTLQHAKTQLTEQLEDAVHQLKQAGLQFKQAQQEISVLDKKLETVEQEKQQLLVSSERRGAVDAKDATAKIEEQRKEIASLREENAAQQANLRLWLVRYKEKGDKKLDSINVELQKSSKRWKTLIAWSKQQAKKFRELGLDMNDDPNAAAVKLRDVVADYIRTVEELNAPSRDSTPVRRA